MRRRLAPWWPALSLRFGIHPWDVERLTKLELQGYVDAAAELARRGHG